MTLPPPSLTNKKIIITGGAGFIGTQLASQLAVKNQVTVIDHKAGSVLGVNYIVGNYHQLNLKTILKHQDVVFHLAWSSSPASRLSNHIEDQLNIKPSVQLLKHLPSTVNHLIFISSAGPVYGLGPTPFKESQSPHPINSYGNSKLQVENIFKEVASNQLKVTVFRPTNIIGQNQKFHHKQGVLPAIIHAYLRNQPFSIWGNASKDYLAVSDAISAMISIPRQSSPFEIYNLGSQTLLTTKHLVRLAEQVWSHRLHKVFQPQPLHDISLVKVSTHKVSRQLKWSAQADIPDIIKQIFKQAIIVNEI